MSSLPEYVTAAIGDLASAARIEQKAIMRLPTISAVEPYIKDRRQAEADLKAAIKRYGAENRDLRTQTGGVLSDRQSVEENRPPSTSESREVSGPNR